MKSCQCHTRRPGRYDKRWTDRHAGGGAGDGGRAEEREMMGARDGVLAEARAMAGGWPGRCALRHCVTSLLASYPDAWCGVR
jgi:hypothetical protein